MSIIIGVIAVIIIGINCDKNIVGDRFEYSNSIILYMPRIKPIIVIATGITVFNRLIRIIMINKEITEYPISISMDASGYPIKT